MKVRYDRDEDILMVEVAGEGVVARTWDDYFDFLPFARQYLREVLGA